MLDSRATTTPPVTTPPVTTPPVTTPPVTTPSTPAKTSDFCANSNQCGVGYALDALYNAGDLNAELDKAIELIKKDQVGEMYNSLSGEVYASTRAVLLSNLQMRNQVQARMRGLGAQRLAFAALQQPLLLASNNAVGYGSTQNSEPSKRPFAPTIRVKVSPWVLMRI